MAYENTIEINNSTWTEVPLSKGTYYIEAVDPSTVIEYSLDSNGADPFTITSGSSQYTLDAPASLYFKASSLFNGKTTKVYINDYSTRAAAPLAAPQSQSISINNQWTELALGAGSYFILPEAGSLIVSMSLSPTGDNSKALKRGGEQVSLNSPASIYFKLNTEDNLAEGQIKYNTINVIASTGSGGSGPTPTPTTYTFNSPLNETNGVVSLRYAGGLSVLNGNLIVDLTNNSDFQALQLQVTNNEAELHDLEISVQNNEADIVVLQNDVAANKTAIQNLDNSVVKLTGDQSIGGTKTFTGSLIVSDPTQNNQAANKLYVDTAIADNTLVFQGALQKVGSNVSIGLENDIVLNATGDKLTLDLNANNDFRNVLLGLDEAKRIATYSEVGRVMPKQNDFVMDGLTGELSLDTSASGTLKQNFVDLNSQQIIPGIKDFTSELRANNLRVHENGTGYGAVDINHQDGYFSISENGGQGAAVNLLAAMGFIDNTTTFRIKNLAGGVVTFNTIAQYETLLTPTNDTDLVHLAYVRQIREELINLVQSLQGGITFIGVISNTKDEVEANPDLLSQFVQTTAGRAARNGDFVKTSDSYGFIFNGTDWRNFGQVSISVATTTQAGIVMLGTNEGELEDVGGGKVKVIGWDTIKSLTQDLDTRVTNNTNNIQTINGTLATKADTANVVLNNADQTINGVLTSTGGYKIEKANPSMLFTDTTGNKTSTIKTIDNGANLEVLLPNAGSFQIRNGKLRYFFGGIPTVTADNEIPSYKQIKDEFLKSATAATTYVPLSTTNAETTIQVSNDASKYFDLGFIRTGTGYRNWSGIRLKTKASPTTQAWTNMWTVTYKNTDDLGIFMSCIGNKLTFEPEAKIIGVQCTDADTDNTAATKGYVDTKITTSVSLSGDQTIGGVKDFTGTILSQSSDRTYGSNRYYADNDASGLGTPVFNTFGTKTEKQASVGFTDANNQGKFEIKVENLPSRPNPTISLGNNTEINGTLNVTGDITAPNMPEVLPAGTVPTTTNVGSMKVAFVLK